MLEEGSSETSSELPDNNNNKEKKDLKGMEVVSTMFLDRTMDEGLFKAVK